MEQTGLYDMDNSEDYYTWSNKQSECAIYSRIDKVLGIMEWFQDHSDYNLTVMHPSVSDHAMLCLKRYDTPCRKRSNFKFINSTADLEGFLNVVESNWKIPIHGRPMYILWKKL